MAYESSKDEEMSNLIGYFAERLNRVFAYFFCIVQFEDDEDFVAEPFNNGRAWRLQTIRGACLHTTLIALRDIDDVFSPRTPTTKDDDLRISDFGYPKGLKFLTNSERVQINKAIAHTTLPGSKLPAPRWDIFELTSKGILQSVEFLKWTEKHYADHFLTWTMALYCRNRTQKIYDSLAKSFRERRQNNAPTDEPGNA